MTEKWIIILGTLVTIIANLLAVTIGITCINQGYAWLVAFLALPMAFIDYIVCKYYIIKYDEYRKNKR